MKAPAAQRDRAVAALARIATPTISDALDRLGIGGQVAGIKPLDRSFRLAGRVFTCFYQPVDAAGGTVGDFIDDVPPGDVVVIDNRGRADATVWGDLLTYVAHQRQVGGTVIDGICRDSDRSLQAGYPLFARGTWMRTGKDRVRLAGTQVPVTAGGVPVRPGDIAVGDGDGVVVVPAERAGEVLEVARGIEAAEDRVRQLVAAGSRLDAARAEAGYHALQSRARPAAAAPAASGGKL